MRCDSCEKFVSMENGDVEVDSLEVNFDDAGYTINAEFSLPRNCAECGQELKRGNFSVEETFPDDEMEKCQGVDATDGAHALTIDEESTDSSEGGGGRYKKNMIRAEVGVSVSCTNKGCGFARTHTLTDELAAGQFEEV